MFLFQQKPYWFQHPRFPASLSFHDDRVLPFARYYSCDIPTCISVEELSVAWVHFKESFNLINYLLVARVSKVIDYAPGHSVATLVDRLSFLVNLVNGISPIKPELENNKTCSYNGYQCFDPVF